MLLIASMQTTTNATAYDGARDAMNETRLLPWCYKLYKMMNDCTTSDSVYCLPRYTIIMQWLLQCAHEMVCITQQSASKPVGWVDGWCMWQWLTLTARKCDMKWRTTVWGVVSAFKSLLDAANVCVSPRSLTCKVLTAK